MSRSAPSGDGFGNVAALPSPPVSIPPVTHQIREVNPFEVREPIQTLRAEKFNADKHLRGGLQKKLRRGKLMVGMGSLADWAPVRAV